MNLYYVDTSNNENLFKKYDNDAGYDICSNEDVEIPANNSILVNTGLFLEIPNEYVGILKSRSGLSVKYKIETGAGVIDSSYRGEIKVHLYNYNNKPFLIKKGDRITQIIFVKYINIKPIKVNYLSNTSRNLDGFGSTGI